MILALICLLAGLAGGAAGMWWWSRRSTPLVVAPGPTPLPRPPCRVGEWVVTRHGDAQIVAMTHNRVVARLADRTIYLPVVGIVRDETGQWRAS